MCFRTVPIGILMIAGFTANTIAQEPENTKKVYVKQTFGPKGLATPLAPAGLNQVRGAPHEWGGGIAGFGKRFASAFGTHVIKHTVQYPIAKFRHEQIEYRRSEETGFGPRLKHAVLATVITPKTNREGETIATGHIAGAVSAGFLSRLWQPARLHTVASGLSTSGLILVGDAGANMLREFWPEIRHPRSHSQDQAKPSPVPPPATPAAATPTVRTVPDPGNP